MFGHWVCLTLVCVLMEVRGRIRSPGVDVTSAVSSLKWESGTELRASAGAASRCNHGSSVYPSENDYGGLWCLTVANG